ncbi:repulsive guidance molecule A-like [Saccoglossus kowalevskii]|uniref:Repulsive guidance molecule A-like isoform X1 n=1 Tax=Saccoglossus kowalevskii TaxID=10224 RepID=A0A1B1JCG1_SACKO|nr:PREDICTED: repulsive guidance molecule A-like isoform X1 [Saccoglossus kowalevskii]XP_006823394.1 PREDICTED: repulsive guidance molecule A-like isoform X2 [Saccoglossus kowalevskii]ANS11601.1 repulsive guidance molecule A-like protein [Saccoglossus kowalevskii]
MTMITRAYRAATSNQLPSARTAWKGMGRRRFCSLAVRPSPIFLQIVILVTLASSVNSACKILKCSKEYADNTDHLSPTSDAEYCDALRLYRSCVDATARTCRGDLHYHTTVTLIPDLMQTYNCSNTPPAHGGGSHHSRPTPKPSEVETRCSSHHGPRTFKHCGLFGDPHLRTFDDVFETCKVAGAWPLIDNRHLAVQVTNVPLVDGSSATATDQLTVIIKGHSECSEQKLYQAQTGNLPASFVDGTYSSGPGRSLVIVEILPGKHVEIHAKFIATTIVVRQVGSYLTFAIRMPGDLVDTGVKDGLELCVKGCPHQEKIDFNELLSSPNQIKDTSGLVMSKETAIAKCLEANVTDFYFDSCVFDLITTGDVNFTMAAKKALKDYQELLPNANVHRNRTTDVPLQNKTSLEVAYNRAPSRTTNCWTLGACIVLLVLLSMMGESRH